MSRPKRPAPALDVPVASLIDVVFLLLVFFLVTSSEIVEESLITTRAGSSGPPTQAKARLLRIDVTPAGPRVGIGQSTRIVSLAELYDHLAGTHQLDPNAAISVAAAPQATQQQLVEVLDTCHRAGTTNVVLLGKKR